ncbi:MAG: prolipoprotein diacylglyceryl transferase [Deltaproteobacteria bacterium]|nr:prolipoprotein diacylglyceryl transferase [Deltaproteobacteria bacterium]
MYPVLFEIFGFPISTFGVMVAAGFLAGGFLAARSFERAGLPGKAAWDMVTWCVVGGLLGAKLWYVAEQVARDGGASAFELLTSRGGITWYGGFLGGTILGLWAAHSSKVPLLTAANCAAPSLAVGQALGRIGCFLVGDDYGVRSDVPWAVAFPQGLPPTIDPATNEVFRVHATMLYETLWLLPVGALLWRRRARSPFLFGEYLMLSGIGRLVIESYRLNPILVGPFSNAQVVALVCIAIGASGWLWLRANPAAAATRAKG